MARCWCLATVHGLVHGEVMELGENSWAWIMARCWSFAKFTGVDHGEELDWLGPWMEVGIFMGLDHGEVKELE